MDQDCTIVNGPSTSRVLHSCEPHNGKLPSRLPSCPVSPFPRAERPAKKLRLARLHSESIDIFISEDAMRSRLSHCSRSELPNPSPATRLCRDERPLHSPGWLEGYLAPHIHRDHLLGLVPRPEFGKERRCTDCEFLALVIADHEAGRAVRSHAKVGTSIPIPSRAKVFSLVGWRGRCLVDRRLP